MAMNRFSLKIEKNEIGFFVPYVIYLVAYMLSMSFYYQYYIGHMKPLIIGCLFMLLVRELYGKRPDRKEAVAIVLCCVVLFTELLARNNSMLTMGAHVFFLYSARKIPFRKIAGWSALIMSCVLFAVVLSAECGLITNYLAVDVSETGAFIRVREYLGFLYALYSSAFYFSATALFICFWKEKITAAGLIFLAGGALFFFLRTNSRLSFLFALLILVCALLLKLLSGWIKEIRALWILKWAFMICALVSFLLVILYAAKVPAVIRLNELLSYRIGLSLRSLRLYGAGIIGQPVNWVGHGLTEYGLETTGVYLFVDNIYLHMLQLNGMLYALLYILLNTWSLDKIYKRKDVFLLILLAIIAVYGLIDNLMENLFFCPFWFVLPTELAGGPRILRKKRRSA